MPFWDIAAIVAAAGLSTGAALFWIMRPGPTSASPSPDMTRESRPDGISFLFDREDLHHASETAQQLYRLIPGQDDWQSWRERMLNRFPSLPEHPMSNQPGSVTVPARHAEDTATLKLTHRGQFTQIHMDDDRMINAAQSQKLRALHRELADLRRASDTTPHAVWQVDQMGKVTWHNAAYEDLYNRLHNTAPQTTKPVFEVSDAANESTGRQRVSTQSKADGRKDWYDVNAVTVGDITIFHAVDVNAVVKSEVAQRNFVQTLAKTFAQLSIGLAIFDRNGQLALFNPALIDLTDLPADFLSGRPTLLSFFDRMRENRRMPEPKNYHSWRQEISEVIAAATDGRYQETWTLETGQTYRVRGRPHPDGAIAFLIEDISAEVSLTRNFRAELELGQSLMDTFDEALVVFSSTGVLTFCNIAYRELWGLDPDNSFADVTIADSVHEWKRLCKPGTRWPALTDFVRGYGDRTTWDMPAKLSDGTALSCTVSRIASGATVIRFIPTGATKAKSARTKLNRPSA
ncbi:PAS-domain containing protein [uncultured Roseobacter sp.]|uniref:PAS-domain containing protein n=1 Tax=uncultured Roseobacter sp. TaxID=114847 RepID=UPI0026123596|nr:PAS-domain containing protein [uncultured Roseobacter sp.]